MTDVTLTHLVYNLIFFLFSISIDQDDQIKPKVCQI